ncbi:MAG: type II secretion system F family protein, partial [Eubacterium sp.]
IAADKRLDELKKREGDVEEIALVKHESKLTKRKKRQKKSSNFFEKMASSLYLELQSADIKMRPEEFLTIWILLAVVPASLVVLFLQNPVVAAVLLVAGTVLPLVVIKNKQKSRVKKFDEQLSDALMISVSGLKSGLTFTQTMETIAKDMDDPISLEFSMALTEMSMGTSMDEALEKMRKRINSSHLALMVSAVLVQRQTGGNLSQILENISNTIKERMKLKQELRSSTASGKMSGMLVGCMPIAMMLLFSAVNYDFIKPLFETTTGHILLGIAAFLEILCMIAIKKITSVKM